MTAFSASGMGEQTLMSYKTICHVVLSSWWFPELFEARRASRRLACACTCSKQSSWNFDWLHYCTCKTSLILPRCDRSDHDQQRCSATEWSWSSFISIDQNVESSSTAEDEKSWLCDSVPKVQPKRMRVLWEGSTKTTKLPPKVTKKRGCRFVPEIQFRKQSATDGVSRDLDIGETTRVWRLDETGQIYN